MRDAMRAVIEFEKACGHELSEKPPCFPDEKTAVLRRSLIREEYMETIEAIDYLCDLQGDGAPEKIDAGLAELADGLADLIFVCVGTAIHFGIDLDRVWKAVCESNMSKFGEGSWVDETGKRRKPPGFKPPDIAAVLARQRPLADTYGANGGEA